MWSSYIKRNVEFRTMLMSRVFKKYIKKIEPVLNILNETILTGLIAYIWYFYTFLETRRFEHFAVVRGHG